ncbi:uncharacterized protein LAESUDRAFT_738040 [Laetiporus sulphureus 93-53]|uniref:MULE transposase domain-containing protein n=1 Tax=Laetiporus sulphureus 93-53 TaxID=1314785 RepID=A0A165D077_9APHY|nr:uncharacterized protein LAESUDRAFT_738040 [Laetiporus sulphureus 93-53]KZT03873.1 hypothetical protein LAESUDRAFT_738040 [Laetiporus sulphureus 93-53]
MDQFLCDGWLHLTIGSGSLEIKIKMKHAVEHVAYIDIDLPDNCKKHIRLHACNQTPGEIWWHILRTELQGQSASEVELPFHSKAVYYYWHLVSRQEWKKADDPLESARLFIEKHGEEHNIALLDVKAAPGMQVLAFQVKDFVAEWRRIHRSLLWTQPVCLWNTNAANFELFSAVADARGFSIPLAFLLMSMSAEAKEGVKEEVSKNFLKHLKGLGVDPEFMLTDKDWSEINAMHATWSRVKHQLCFWHAFRALKQRLAKNKDTPAFYDVSEARKEFPYIKADFMPYMQYVPCELSEAGPHTKQADYAFCPAKRTSADIRRDVVKEMCLHCEVNNLCEIWAYLWNSWYSRSRWPLWARSAYGTSIPCKQTTMMVEALWQNLKCLILHLYNRSPIDLAVHAIITKALPPYRKVIHVH